MYIIIPGLGPSLDRRGCALCIFSVFTVQAAKKHKDTLWMNDTLDGKKWQNSILFAVAKNRNIGGLEMKQILKGIIGNSKILQELF